MKASVDRLISLIEAHETKVELHFGPGRISANTAVSMEK